MALAHSDSVVPAGIVGVEIAESVVVPSGRSSNDLESKACGSPPPKTSYGTIGSDRLCNNVCQSTTQFRQPTPAGLYNLALPGIKKRNISSSSRLRIEVVDSGDLRQRSLGEFHRGTCMVHFIEVQYLPWVGLMIAQVAKRPNQV